MRYPSILGSAAAAQRLVRAGGSRRVQRSGLVSRVMAIRGVTAAFVLMLGVGVQPVAAQEINPQGCADMK